MRTYLTVILPSVRLMSVTAKGGAGHCEGYLLVMWAVVSPRRVTTYLTYLTLERTSVDCYRLLNFIQHTLLA